MKIDADKRERILKSAFEEFAKNGYDRASTNVIVKKAGISKGLLFHYFGTKEQLYSHLMQFACDLFTEELENGIDWEKSDIFERVKRIERIRTEVFMRYPYLYDFLKRSLIGRTDRFMQNRFSEDARRLMTRIYTENIDLSGFPAGVDSKRALTVLQWSIGAIWENVWRSSPPGSGMEEMEAETGRYLETLRQIYLGPEGQKQ